MAFNRPIDIQPNEADFVRALDEYPQHPSPAASVMFARQVCRETGTYLFTRRAFPNWVRYFRELLNLDIRIIDRGGDTVIVQVS